MRSIRTWFAAADLLEIDTPALSPYAVSDTQIESLEIPKSVVSQGPLYLHTSPEFCMKRLLSAGYPDIYSICRVFRDGESGRRHQPEYTMIEWYRLGFSLQDIIDDTLSLIGAVLPNAALANEPQQYDYREIFLHTTGLDPFTADIEELAHAAEADSDLLRSVDNERDDWLDLILATRITPALPRQRLTVLRHFPASQAALARLCPDDSLLADRFEVFCGPLELANGYVELTDAKEQLRRIEADNDDRRRRNRAVRPADIELLAALAAGLPACAGVAMGFERLQMIHDGTDDIGDVVTFPFGADQ
jgi:lysyl-tRNA synthetase class 2